MVNITLKCGLRRWSGSPEYFIRWIKYKRRRPRQWQLGVWDRVIGFWQSGMKCGVAIAVLSAAFLGCAAPEKIEQVTLTKSSMSVHSPNGVVEVYDPTRDPQVQKAFKVVYDNSDKNLFISDVSPGIDAGYGDYAEKLDSYSSEVRLLRSALKHQRESYAFQGCRIINTSECGTWWQVQMDSDCTKNNEKDCSASIVRAAANTAARCSVGNQTAYDRVSHPVGQYFFSSLEEEAYATLHDEHWPKTAPSLQTQLRNFFKIQCRKWAEFTK